MSWGVLFALAWLGWIGLHRWLGNKGRLKILGALVALEVGGFVAFWFWLQEEAKKADPSAGAATGMAFFGGIFALLVPAIVGVLSLFRNRPPKQV